MNEKSKMMILSWTAVLLWLVLIFYLSAQPAVQSDALSKKVTEVIVETVERIAPADDGGHTTIDLVESFNHMVRKYAHGGVYFVLGVLMMMALRQSGVRGGSDEVYQLFVLGRGAQVTDVLIDGAGAIVGALVYGVGSLCQLTVESGQLKGQKTIN